MNVSEITTQLYNISRALVEKTGERPWVAPKLVVADNGCIIELMRAYRTSGCNDYVVGIAKGDTPDDAIANAFSIIAALPDLDTAKLRDHMKRVADCIDRGRDDGIDDAYIMPLVAVKAAMTENLLTKQVSA
jgi:hypothetical protein